MWDSVVIKCIHPSQCNKQSNIHSSPEAPDAKSDVVTGIVVGVLHRETRDIVATFPVNICIS